MIKNYFKTAIRNIWRNKIQSLINIIGLSVGLASAILILSFVWFEMSYDNFHPDVKNTYRVYCDQPDNNYMNSTLFNVMPVPFQPEVKKNFPEVKYATRVSANYDLLSVDRINYTAENYYAVDQDFLNMFELFMVYGQKEDALVDKYSILLSENIASKYFGDQNPVGEVLVMNDTINLVVKGVFKEIRSNTHFKFQVLVPFSLEEMTLSASSKTAWDNHSVKTYIQLNEGSNAPDLETKLKAFIISKRDPEVKDSYLLQPVRDIHLYGKLNFELSANGDIKYIYIFGAIALFLILIASFNYMNLATAQSLRRAKEVGVLKVLGASRKQLFRQFIGESIFYTFLSLIVALVLIEIFEPGFNNFVNREIDFYNHSLVFYVLVIIVVLLIGLISGSYPALYLSRFSPVKVLKGSVSGSSRNVYLRNIIVVFQFFISIVLIISTLFIISQLHYIRNKDLGFDTKNILTFSMNYTDWKSTGKALQNELMKLPEIQSVTSSDYLPSRITSTSSFYYNDRESRKSSRIYYNRVGFNIIDFYNIPLLRGENFSSELSNGKYLIINEEAEKAMNVDDVIGMNIEYGWPKREKYTILGVMKNFHFTPLNQTIQPAAFFLTDGGGRRFSVKVVAGMQDEAIKSIEAVVKKFSPRYSFNYASIQDTIDGSYTEERRLSGLFTFFTVLAVIIACLGLFGLISFIVDQRTKEIGIRKIMGASVQNIIALFSKSIVRWVLISNLIAWPVAWYFMNKWLQNFAYCIKLDIGIFLVAGFITLLIALLTTGFQTIKTALMNPIESLKYE